MIDLLRTVTISEELWPMPMFLGVFWVGRRRGTTSHLHPDHDRVQQPDERGQAVDAERGKASTSTHCIHVELANRLSAIFLLHGVHALSQPWSLLGESFALPFGPRSSGSSLR